MTETIVLNQKLLDGLVVANDTPLGLAGTGMLFTFADGVKIYGMQLGKRAFQITSIAKPHMYSIAPAGDSYGYEDHTDHIAVILHKLNLSTLVWDKKQLRYNVVREVRIDNHTVVSIAGVLWRVEVTDGVTDWDPYTSIASKVSNEEVKEKVEAAIRLGTTAPIPQTWRYYDQATLTYCSVVELAFKSILAMDKVKSEMMGVLIKETS